LTRIELNSVMLPRCGAVEQGGEGQLDIVLKAVHFLSRKGRTADELGMAVSRNRSVQSDLRIQNRAISRLHAELHLHDNKVRETTSLHPYSTRRHVRHSGAACELAIQHRGIAVSWSLVSPQVTIENKSNADPNPLSVNGIQLDSKRELSAGDLIEVRCN
jgi:hypothetical protein